MRNFIARYTVLMLLFTIVILVITYIPGLNPSKPEEVEENQPAHQYRVQVVLKARANPPDFWRIVEQGLKMGGDEFNVKYEVNGPSTENDIDTQISMVRAAIKKKPDVLILAAGDFERLAPVCEEAVAAGIRLISLDSDVNSDKKLCFVGTDNYELGQKLGFLVDGILKPGDTFGVIGHVESSFTAMERERGLMDAVENVEERMAAIRFCGSSVDRSRKQTIEIIQQHPEITCMVGLNESSALGICRALDDLGMTGDIRVVACDSSETQIKYMESGVIQSAVIQNPFNMGYLSMVAAVRIMNGEKVEPYINTGSVVIDRDAMRRPENQKLLFPFIDESYE
ncbi:MAG: substrate-binding domain-containing protein [Clostridiales Family XIII bacterium]|jgi:ribose transport system substrate-binding protein|nr:substrate-binding domain-containing protein [Clostridiales Family XIII bacterium]